MGAAEEEQRGREEATIEHAFDSILIPAPSLRCSQRALPPSEETRRDDALRGVAWGARREKRGEGTARRVEESSGKGRKAEEVGRLLMALARPCRTHTDTRGPRGCLLRSSQIASRPSGDRRRRLPRSLVRGGGTDVMRS